MGVRKNIGALSRFGLMCILYSVEDIIAKLLI
jgi:hypothetical protein